MENSGNHQRGNCSGYGARKKREGAPEGKLKGKGSDRKVASLTLVLRAQTWLWGRERRCKTGQNVNYNKEQGLCPGETLTPHLGKREMVPAALQGWISSCHRRGDTKRVETVDKEPQRWQQKPWSTNHARAGCRKVGRSRWARCDWYRASSEGRGGNKIHLWRRIVSLETGNGHKHIWGRGCPFPSLWDQPVTRGSPAHNPAAVLGGVMLHGKEYWEKKAAWTSCKKCKMQFGMDVIIFIIISTDRPGQCCSHKKVAWRTQCLNYDSGIALKIKLQE